MLAVLSAISHNRGRGEVCGPSLRSKQERPRCARRPHDDLLQPRPGRRIRPRLFSNSLGLGGWEDRDQQHSWADTAECCSLHFTIS